MSEPQANIKFLASYFHNGSWWGVEIYAVDWDDAETICRKLNLRLDGEHKFSVPAIGPTWIPDAICRVRNRLFGDSQ